MKATVTGIRAKIDQLRGMTERLQNPQPAMEAGAQAVVKFVSDRFRTQTDPEGAAWTPLAESTKARRRRGPGRFNPRILQDTGVLKNSITAVAGPRSLTFGTNTPYAGFHQFGTRNAPRRAFLPVGPDGQPLDVGPAKDLIDRIARVLGAYVRTGKLTG